MNAFRITLPHRDAMPKLLEWCDEAAVVHRNQESAELPDWETAVRRMAESGRLSKVNHPSADQRAGRLDFIRKKAAPNGGGLDMQLSREARLVAGLTLLTVPTIMYGGITLLGILTKGTAGLAPGGLTLDETQWALFRAGHAHAGVWVVLSLVIQVLLDAATLPAGLKWLARISASGGSGWNRGRVFRHRLRARLPVAALLRSSEPRRRCGTDRHRVSEAPEWQSITVRRTLLPRQERSSQTRNHGTTPYGWELPPGTTRIGEVDSDSLFRVFRWIPWLISDLLSSRAGR